jgi:hypothetical protein
VVHVALLHLVIGADDLESIPCEYFVELPRAERDAHGTHGQKDWCGEQEGPDAGKHNLVIDSVSQLPILVVLHVFERSAGLVDLDGGVHNERQVGKAHADDLDGVLGSQGIPNQDILVDEAEVEEGEEGRNDVDLFLEVVADVALEVRFDFQVDIAIEKVRVLHRQQRMGGKLTSRRSSR